jgi:hypothetical protein
MERRGEMKRVLAQWMVVIFVLACTTTVAFAAKDGKGEPIKGQDVSISGKVTCTFCNLANPGKTCQQGCCERCIKAGDPPMLTTADGDQYILLTGEHEVPLMTPERYQMLGGTVNVKGVMVKGKSLQAIYVDQMTAK